MSSDSVPVPGETSGRRAAGGSIRAATPATLDRLRQDPGRSSEGRSNLVWLGGSMLEILACAAGDRPEGVTAEMMGDWYEGNWTDPRTGRRPGQSEQSKKQRRWAARRVVPAAVSTGAIAARSEVVRFLEPRPSACLPGDSDDDPVRIAHVTASWQRRYADPSQAQQLTAEARRCVEKAAPANVSTARLLLLIVYLALEWGLRMLGTAAPHAVLHPVNVEALTMDPDRGWSDSWRAQMRSGLRRVGRAVCPQHWPDEPQPIPARDAARPYDPVDEYMWREAALMAGRRPLCERLATVGLTLGAGLSGAQAYRTSTEDIIELDGNRLAVRVQRDRTRIVPIRKHYTGLVAEARDLRGDGRLFSSDKQAAPSNVAARIRVDGFGHLLIHRTRATFVCAHIRAGTSLGDLNEIAGPISGPYLQQMLAYCADSVDPIDAVTRGLAA